MDSSLARNDLDGLLYNSIVGTILMCGQSINFNFNIKHYHNLIRYKIMITKQSDKISVKIIDSDYRIKSSIFS